MACMEFADPLTKYLTNPLSFHQSVAYESRFAERTNRQNLFDQVNQCFLLLQRFSIPPAKLCFIAHGRLNGLP